ncbi:MAG: type II toxin-antitoxin system prevent-host-death family antitoxin, partial [Burkholderiaceae bacterium]
YNKVIFLEGSTMSIAVHELKANLSKVLTRAQQGEVIEITSHDKLIARITGIPQLADKGLQKLISNGAVSWNGKKPVLRPPLQLSTGGKSVSEMVLEDRR